MLTEVACINVSLSTRRAVEIDECLRVASAIWNVDSDDMMSKARSHVVAEARMVVMDHLRSKGMTLQKIGGIFRRDHGTVIHAVRTVADRQASDHEFAARLRAFRIQLTPTKPNNGQPE